MSQAYPVQVSFELELKQAQARLAQQEAAAADLAAHARALQGQVAAQQGTLQVEVPLLCWLKPCMGGPDKRQLAAACTTARSSVMGWCRCPARCNCRCPAGVV